MTEYELQVVQIIKNISMQVEGLSDVEIGPDLMVLGGGSPFDSFAMLLFLVELEGNIDANLLAGRSLVEWFSSVEYSDNTDMNVSQFTDLLFNDYLTAGKA